MGSKPPEWFNLRNYDDLKSFDLSDWYTQLSYRNWMKFALSDRLLLSDRAQKFLDECLLAIQSGVVKRDYDMDLDYILSHKKPSIRDLSA